MTHEDIDNAVAEAERFIERAKAARAAMNYVQGEKFGYWENNDTKATAALKRSSMDLSRSLVAIRKCG